MGMGYIGDMRSNCIYAVMFRFFSHLECSFVCRQLEQRRCADQVVARPATGSSWCQRWYGEAAWCSWLAAWRCYLQCSWMGVYTER